jgi:hypothetical protein
MWFMRPLAPSRSPRSGAGYFACRLGGAPPEFAQTELGLTSEAVVCLERLFQARPGGGPDPMKPRFARHQTHVSAVMAQGGFPVLGRS